MINNMQNNFLVTIWIIFLISLSGIAYILYYLEPSFISLIFLLLGIFFAVSTVGSLIWFKFTTIARFEDPKVIFRSCFKKAMIIGLVIPILILIQFYFNLI